MLTLYYSPQTRATRIVGLLMKMGHLEDVEVKTVGVQRRDGSGGADPNNLHPEGKVPLLVHDGEVIRESPAIILYLTDHFNSPLGRAIREKGRGEYLSWLAYYGDIVEPVTLFQFLPLGAPEYANILDNPAVKATFRGPEELKATLMAGLNGKRFLLGDTFSAADLLLSSTYMWFPAATPDDPVIRDWVARCAAELDQEALTAFETAAMKELELA